MFVALSSIRLLSNVNFPSIFSTMVFLNSYFLFFFLCFINCSLNILIAYTFNTFLAIENMKNDFGGGPVVVSPLLNSVKSAVSSL